MTISVRALLDGPHRGQRADTAVLPLTRGETDAEVGVLEAGARQGGARRSLSASEAGWMVAALAVLAGGIAIWSVASTWAWAVPVSLVIDVMALGAFVSILAFERATSAAQLALLAGAGAVIALGVARAVLAASSYGTDEAAFNQYAAGLLLHGVDPYTRSMVPALSHFSVPDGARTYLVTGKLVGSYSYPALSFLPLVPLLALGIHTQSPIVLDAAAWIATMMLTWLLLPRSVRFCAPLVGLGALALGYVSSGLNDPVELPLLLGALFAWDRFVDGEASRIRRLAGPLALGLACAVKPTPWFLAPFLVVAVVLEARSRGLRPVRPACAYLAWVAAGFLAPNLAFVAWAPSAWLRGILFPVIRPTVAGGQGLVALLLLHGGGPLRLLDIAGLLVLAAGLFALCAFYRQLRGALVVLAGVALLVPARSFGSYVVFLAPVALVGALSLGTAPVAAGPGRVMRKLLALAAAGTFVASLVTLTAALFPPPVALSVTSTGLGGAGGRITSVSLKISNRSGTWIAPHFVVSGNGLLGAFWPVVSGAKRVGPHSAASVKIEAPDVATMPDVSSPIVVDAFLGDRVVSVRAAAPIPWHASLEPRVVPPVPTGRTVVLRVQLTDDVGSPVKKAGVRVALTQTMYGPAGEIPAQAVINGHAEGQSPVAAVTDRSGEARFRISEPQRVEAPAYFQAWIGSGGVLEAYSNQVLVRFAGGGGRSR